ncbi:MAG: hypothetical protein ISS50_01665 [Anaerolineae bacterium]|nr:hypothetical protein [Anaerolineae bacterium]
MEITWDKTTTAMREAGLTEEEIGRFREDPLDTLLRLLDQGKSVPICFQYRGFVIQLEGDVALEALGGGLE